MLYLIAFLYALGGLWLLRGGRWSLGQLLIGVIAVNLCVLLTVNRLPYFGFVIYCLFASYACRAPWPAVVMLASFVYTITFPFGMFAFGVKMRQVPGIATLFYSEPDAAVCAALGTGILAATWISSACRPTQAGMTGIAVKPLPNPIPPGDRL